MSLAANLTAFVAAIVASGASTAATQIVAAAATANYVALLQTVADADANAYATVNLVITKRTYAAEIKYECAAPLTKGVYVLTHNSIFP